MKNHLFIGLGGQGGRTLGELRKVMAQRAADTEALHNQDVKIEFLAIDSSSDVRNDKGAWSYFGTDLSLEQHSWLILERPGQDAINGLAIRSDIAPWLGDRKRVEDFLLQSKIEGANQRRRFGRLLFAYNAGSIRHAVFANKVAALTNSRPNQCAFHIFATLGGGTGSGCLVDLVATIRDRYPEQGGIDNYPIFVYVYVTNEDSAGADVGYFFQNQYVCLVDLNALMCDRLQLHLLGEGGTHLRYTGSEPIAQLVITSSLNSNNMRLPLETQIRIVAESCLERIYAWSSGQMSPDAQRVITGQDILATFPGEPSGRIERSYRFAGFGMRRWEVPHAKLEALIALDLLASSLVQMLFNEWREDRGFIDQLGPAESTGAVDAVSVLSRDLQAVRIPSPGVDTLVQTLQEELLQQAEGLQRGGAREPLDPRLIERKLNAYYQDHFQHGGVEAFIKQREFGRPAAISDAVRRIESRLTELWLDRTNPFALARIPQTLDELGNRLRGELDAKPGNAAEITRRRKVIEARRLEWDKLTWLTSGVTSKRRQFVEAHARDCSTIHEMDLRDRLTALDAAFVRAFLNELAVIKNRFMSTQLIIGRLLDRTVRERDLIAGELNDLHRQPSANKYEFDPAALDAFLQWMRRHHEHQHSTAHLLRAAIHAYCGPNQPLSMLDAADKGESPIEETLRRVAIDQARHIHQHYKTNRQGEPILGGSLMDWLQRRFQQEPTALQLEVNAFMERAAVCLHLRNDTQPVELLGGGLGVPPMPKRSLLLGLPRHAYADTLRRAFQVARSAGATYQFDAYTHDDPTQVRLLLVDYWLAARFASVLRDLAQRYQQTTPNPQAAADTLYFCNIDGDGENGRRPSLFLPSAEEMRLRYEAELWLGQQPDINVIISDKNGVSLIFDGEYGRRTEPLAISLDDAMQTADHGKMFKLHARLTTVLAGIDPDRLKQLLKIRSDEVEQAHGLTSPEYKRWERMRSQLRNLVL